MTTIEDVLDWATTDVEAAGLCEGFANNQFVSKFGTFRYGYGSANAALAASKAAGTFHPNVAPPKDHIVWVFYDYPEYGHVMLCLDGETALGDTSQAKNKLNATIGTMPYSAYSYPYLGYADTNGVNTIPQIPTPNVNPYGDAGVQMADEVVNRRTLPSTSSPVMDTRAPNQWIEADGVTHEGQPVNGNADWYRDIVGGWYSASVCTAANASALPRLNPDGSPWTAPIALPVAPIEHTVTFDWNDSTTNVTEQITDGQPIADPSIPTRAGFTFSHWTTDAAGVDLFNVTSPITTDLTLYASWTPVPVEPESAKDDAPAAPIPRKPTAPVEAVPAKASSPNKWLTGGIFGVIIASAAALLAVIFGAH